jgi:hypothetical protein
LLRTRWSISPDYKYQNDGAIFTRFSDVNILPTLSAKLSWSHSIELFPLKSKEAKLYYANKAAEEVWGIRELRNQIE